MRAAVLLLLTLAAATGGCLRTTQFQCSTDTDCTRGGAQGVCEAVGYCSFDDPSCGVDGRRYGDLSGSYGGRCVNGDGLPDGGLPDGLIDDDDDDNDGVLDAADNCPLVSNSTQHNEDTDAFGDACDPCPISTTNTDGDGDGVGDACDPRPGMAGDKLVVFEGFGAGVPASFLTEGTWTQVGDDVAVNHAGSGSSNFSISPSTTTNETVAAALQITTLNGTQFNYVGVFDNGAAGNAISCAAFRAMGFSPPIGLSVADSNDGNLGQTVPYEIMTMQPYVFRERRDGMLHSCAAQRGTNTPASVSRSFTLSNTPYSAGVFVVNAAIRVQWFMVVNNP